MLKEGIIIGERYEIVSRVGSGGMADVYKAMDHKLNRMVAVKILKPEYRQDTTFISKFRKEAQAAAGLAHPNIVNVYDVGEDRGLYYIVMELVEGITLKNYIMKKGKLSVKEATSIAIQVSLGLEAAHNQGIVHRDVKPQNIIISTDGKVKLSDFGIAKATNSNTITTNVMGSVHYSSPEQVRGGISDAKSDIYSLGITMYEMVTGRVPFDGDTTVSIAIKHLQEEIIPPSRYTSDLPYALEQIILKCTQKNTDRRYAYIGDLIEDLKKSLIDPQGNFVKIPSLVGGAASISEQPKETVISKPVEPKETEIISDKRYSFDEDDFDEPDEEDFSYPQEKAEKKEKKPVKKPKLTPKTKTKRRIEEDDALSAKLEKAITIGGFLIGAVIVVILIVLVGNMAGLFGSKSSSASSKEPQPTTAVVTQIPTETDSSETVVVPDFLGYTLDEAIELANQYQLIIRQSGTQSSENYPEGQIVYQETLSGTTIKTGSTINVVVSSGGASVIIPNGLTGMAQSDVENTLSGLGLTVIASLQASQLDVGKVVSVSPAEGSKVEPGSVVNVYVSMGPVAEPTTTPTPSPTPVPVIDPNNTVPSIGDAGTVAYEANAAYADSGIATAITVTKPALFEPGDLVTIQLVQGGTASVILCDYDPWATNGDPFAVGVFGMPGYLNGTIEVLNSQGTVIDAFPVNF